MWKIVRVFLTLIYAIITVLIAMVASFADGGSIGERVLISLLHPLAALGLLGMVISRRLPSTTVRYIIGLLAATVVGDLVVVGAIAGGAIKGDWWLLLILAVVPVLGILYGLFRHPGSPIDR